MDRLRPALLSLAAPLLLVAFFAGAGELSHDRIVDAVADTQTDPGTIAWVRQLDLLEVCGAEDADRAILRADLWEAGICADLRAMRIALALSGLTMAISGGYLLVVGLLAAAARPLGERLNRAYRLAWRLTPPAALSKILLETVLGTFLFFELTVLATRTYFPQAILLMLFLGLAGLVAGFRAARLNVPLESTEAFVTPASREQAAELWALLDDAARRVGTPAPDHVLVAESTQFYVTEMKVRHDGGATTGRTLVLSRPMMAEMSPDELVAVVGHELAHFAGGDTVLTRELYPRTLRMEIMAQGLAESLVGASPLQLLRYLQACFLPLVMAQSRIRELAADAVGARLTSPRTQAMALLRTHVLDDAYTLRWKLASEAAAGRPDAAAHLVAGLQRPLSEVARERLYGEDAFWAHLLEKRTTHPLDTHPALADRLAALGEPLTPQGAKAALQDGITVSAAELLHGAADLVERTRAALEQRVAEVSTGHEEAERVRRADLRTPEGRALLEAHFPPVAWAVLPRKVWARAGGYGFVAALLGAAAAALVAHGEVGAGLTCAAIAAIWATFATVAWGRHRGGVLALSVDGIAYTTWRAPLPLGEIATLSFREWAVYADLHERVPVRARWAPPIRSRRVYVPTDLLERPEAAAELLFRYARRDVAR